MPVRSKRAAPRFGLLDENKAAIIKGMLVRGDKQSDIAAHFHVNGGRIAEINRGRRFATVRVAEPCELPRPSQEAGTVAGCSAGTTSHAG
jgi:hypothetical protein